MGRLWERIATCHSLRWLAFQASPSVQSAIPSRARSLMRNCPGTAERAGKPPALDAQTPGVVMRKLRLVRSIPTARALPSAEALVCEIKARNISLGHNRFESFARRRNALLER